LYCDAEDVVLLNYRDQEVTLHKLSAIRKQSAFEEAAEHEPEPEPKERIKTDSKLTKGVWLTEAGIKVL
jgi:hypothetical protein